MRFRILQGIQQRTFARGVVLQTVQPWGVLLQQHESDMPPTLIVVRCGQILSRLLLQCWLQEHHDTDGAVFLRELPCELVLHWKRGSAGLYHECSGSSAIHEFRELLL